MGETTPWEDPRPDPHAFLARLEAGGREADEQERADAVAAAAESRAIEDVRIERERRAAERAASAARHARAIEDAAARAAVADAEAAAASAVVADAEAAVARAARMRRWAGDVGTEASGARRGTRPRRGDRRSTHLGMRPTSAGGAVRGRFGILLAVAAVAVPFLGHPTVLAAVLGGLAGVAALVVVWWRDRGGRGFAAAPIVIAVVTVVATVGIGVAVARFGT